MIAGTILFCIHYGLGTIILSLLTYFVLKKEFKKCGGV